MRSRKFVFLTLIALLVSAAGLVGYGNTPVATVSAQSAVSYSFTWSEGSNFTMAEWWDAQSQAGCDYASNPWPQTELAATRAYILAARSVLRDEWDINTWIKNNRASTSQARIHGTETSCYNGHLDYPPHVHIFYLSIDSSGGWHHINSHHYANALGKIYDNFVIPNLCGQNTSYDNPVNAWLNILDETCGTAWQQRYTTAGDIELRLSASAPVYTLHETAVNGDLATVQVLQGSTLLYSDSVTQYDPLAMTMAASISDYRRNTLTTEAWQGNPSTGNMLASHTTNSSPLSGTPTATATATATATPTNTPRPTATATVTATPSVTATPTATSAPGTGTTFTTTVAAYPDDAYQDGTTLTNNSTTLWIGDNKNPSSSYAGIRFAQVPLPPGASIQSATLQLYSTASNSLRISVNVYGDATGNSVAFSTSSLPGNRPRTTAFTSYANPPAWAANTWYSIDVTPVVQELANRSDWANGNALSLILKGMTGLQGYRRAAKGYASTSSSNVPRLVITYK